MGKQNNFEQINLFATPVWKLETDIQCKPIKSLVHHVKKTNKVGNKLTNMGGWQSSAYPCVEIPQALKPLFSLLDTSVRSCLDAIDIPNPVKMINFWFNINEKGNYNKLHNHRGTLISGVFYIETPENCGSISFERYDDSQYFLPEDLQKRNLFTGSAIHFEPKEGRLLLFPSWLLHQVEPSQTTKPRISMSFNYSIDGVK